MVHNFGDIIYKDGSSYGGFTMRQELQLELQSQFAFMKRRLNQLK